MNTISQERIDELYKTFSPLINLKIDWLTIPDKALLGFEPSQVAVIVNTLLDGILPQIELLASDNENFESLREIGLKKSPGTIGERESYPDYVHISGVRVELKGLFVDNPALKLKRPPTPRENSARLKENVTMDVIQPDRDVLLIAAIQLKEENGHCSPYIADIGVFPVYECIKARDERLYAAGGMWFGKVPKVVKGKSLYKMRSGEELLESDFEKDTNFGKLKRIPYQPLQEFMRKWLGRSATDL